MGVVTRQRSQPVIGPDRRPARLASVADRSLSWLDMLGDQLLFYLRALLWIPRAVRRYLREVLRLLAEVGFGSGALGLIGGTVGVMIGMTLFTGTVVGLQGYSALNQLGTSALTGFISAYFDTREVAPQHLLLGILQAAGNDLSTALSGYGLTADVVRARLVEAAPKTDDSLDEDAEALRAIGIDLAAVRDSVARTFGADAFDNALSRSGRRRGRQRRSSHIPFNPAAKKSLELAVRETLTRKDNEIGCEHLLLGILRSGDKAAIGLITEHVYTAQLRASILALLDKAA